MALPKTLGVNPTNNLPSDEPMTVVEIIRAEHTVRNPATIHHDIGSAHRRALEAQDRADAALERRLAAREKAYKQGMKKPGRLTAHIQFPKLFH